MIINNNIINRSFAKTKFRVNKMGEYFTLYNITRKVKVRVGKFSDFDYYISVLGWDNNDKIRAYGDSGSRFYHNCNDCPAKLEHLEWDGDDVWQFVTIAAKKLNVDPMSLYDEYIDSTRITFTEIKFPSHCDGTKDFVIDDENSGHERKLSDISYIKEKVEYIDIQEVQSVSSDELYEFVEENKDKNVAIWYRKPYENSKILTLPLDVYVCIHYWERNLWSIFGLDEKDYKDEIGIVKMAEM